MFHNGFSGICRPGTRGMIVGATLFAAGLAAGTATAQQNTQDQGRTDIPRTVLTAALAGSEDGLAMLDSFLREGDASPAEIARRAREVLAALNRNGGDADTVARAVARVAQVAATGLSSARVLEIGIEADFTPGEGSQAFDFGPPDLPPQQGFERVTANDPRVTVDGEGGAVRRPGAGTVLDDGIVGLEEFSVPMPNGTYRLILLTEDLGDANLGAGFGTGVMVNDVPIGVRGTDRRDWVPMAVLGNDPQGIVQGARPFRGERGGGVVIEVVVTDGRLRLNIPKINAGRYKSYITGAIVEPVDRPSRLAPSREAEGNIVRLNDLYRLESEVAEAVARTLSDVLPGASQEEIANALQLPAPQFADLRVPSPN